MRGKVDELDKLTYKSSSHNAVDTVAWCQKHYQYSLAKREEQ